MEASMHGSFERSGKSDKSFSERRGTGFFAFPVLLAVALITLAILEPAASKWISEAAQAEFAGIYGIPESTPSQLAQPPSMEVRTVRAY
jgi:uncharacterized membrane protein